MCTMLCPTNMPLMDSQRYKTRPILQIGGSPLFRFCVPKSSMGITVGCRALYGVYLFFDRSKLLTRLRSPHAERAFSDKTLQVALPSHATSACKASAPPGAFPDPAVAVAMGNARPRASICTIFALNFCWAAVA